MARALGRRAIISRGWADLSLVDNEPDSLTSALEHTRQPSVTARSQSIATAMRRDGAQTAAQHLITDAFVS